MDIIDGRLVEHDTEVKMLKQKVNSQKTTVAEIHKGPVCLKLKW